MYSAVMQHEFRTPLGACIMMLEFILTIVSLSAQVLSNVLNVIN